ncbi:DNA-binding HxlR family transcriptional regulator [Streptosporangium becharense]|uniref:DNA-binding HxlR family transcriptional regulator n=1 Tax=Streptosporangium becharense TaxID=1816182 RepID=A0A7W9IJU2_9ACTN|nr:helix-turn-helix domain-containing protein [Streptosporangium becharense]MBB2911192.1 DNA-binding HxlR family transcriptional regulator [Streptosporangium becharense]MBB5821750.1 DNA-binding HxlR family transcriptional regulator [Streptosporangium becharense]
MSGYGQFCAVARALDVLGERWTLLIVRELLLGAATFTDICHGLPRIPRATLSARLRTLRAAGIVDDGYRLTEAGTALAPVVRELARWAVATDSAALTDDHLDTAALTWDMRRRVDVGALPERTVVLAIEFTDRMPSDGNYWLHLSRASVNLCRQDTGAPVDVWLTAPTAAVTGWWLGDLSWEQLLRQPGVRVHGDRALRHRMHHWFKRYLFTPEALGVTDPGR